MVTDVVLSSLINLFALFGARGNVDAKKSRQTISNYLTRHFGIRNQEDYLGMYEELCDLYAFSPELNKEGIVSGIIANLNGHIRDYDEPLILLRMMEFSTMAPDSFDENDPLYRQVSDIFELLPGTYQNLCDFVAQRSTEHVKVLSFPGMKGDITTLLLPGYNLLLFTYHGEDEVSINDVPVIPGLFLQWEKSAILKCQHSQPVYYSQVMEAYGEAVETKKELVEFCGRDVNFRFPGTNIGLHDMSFTLHSGELLAIMGGSGAGKTTLQNLLNGMMHPDTGAITINGHSIDEPEAKSLIGFVPQDDLLVEELTVYQNLWYTARFCFAGMEEAEIDRKVMQVLNDLDLAAAKDLQVGSPIKKFISGGQRKRLNIALELIREPAVLFLDEPTSGLSSSDTERVILLLKEQTLKGKLIVVNIHQPSSDVYKLFDRLWLLDRGGYPIFDGNPIEAVTYFKRAANYADAETSTCPVCGNVNPEVVLNIIDSKRLNQSGQLTDERKVTPEEWHKMYLAEREKNPVDATPEELHQPAPLSDIPYSSQRRPSAARQFLIQLERIMHSKATNAQYMLITLLEGPVLALICGLLTRYVAAGQAYSVMDNKNFVSFLFMAVIVSIFLGMSGSAEEIIKDRALLRREKFLHLSYISYMSSKIAFMAMVALVQTQLFILVGHFLMGMSGVYWVWSLVLFIASLLAGLTGLLLSQCLSSVVAIYITIPILLIPQILLCGLVVDFSDLNSDSETGNVPVIGNLVPSRWAFEAMAVSTFADNDYQRHFFELDREKYETQYYQHIFIGEMRSQLETREHELKQGDPENPIHMEVLRTELPTLSEVAGIEPYQGAYDYASLRAYLEQADKAIGRRSNQVTLENDRQLKLLRDEMGVEQFRQFRRDNYNLKLEQILVVPSDGSTHEVIGSHIVPRMYAVYLKPRTSCGNAPFYSSVKRIGSVEMPTLWFNTLVQLLIAAVLMLILYVDSQRIIRAIHVMCERTMALIKKQNKKTTK